MSDLDNLLDATLDDLEDLPSFAAFPPGAWKVNATLESKEINSKPAIELSLTMVEVVACDSVEEEKLPKAGDKASTLYFLDNEFGRGAFKAVAASFKDYAESSSLREIVEAVTDVECITITSFSKNKNDPDAPYMNVKEISVL